MSFTTQMGQNSFIGFSMASGTAEVAGTGPAEFIRVSNFGFKRDEPEMDVEELLQDRAVRRHVVGNVTCNGTFSKAIDPFNGIALYQHLLAGSITSASLTGSNFTHTFSEGNEVTPNTRLQFMISQGGNSATSRNYFNGVVESYALDCATGSIPKETFNLRFSNHGSALNTAPTVSITEAMPVNFNKVSLKLGATITAVSVTAARNFKLNVNNTIEENRELGTNTVSEFRYARREVTGSFDVVLDTAATNFYNSFINKTYTAINLLMETGESLSATNWSIDWKLPNCIFTGSTPNVDGQGLIVQPITFKAYYSSQASYHIKNSVVNNVSTVTQ